MRGMDIKDKVCMVTGGAGLLGFRFSGALLEAGGAVCLLDIDSGRLEEKVAELEAAHPDRCMGLTADITDEESLNRARSRVMERFGRVDVLVNNAANNPKVEGRAKTLTRLENFELSRWDEDISVGLTGAFLCSRVFGTEMARQRSGVIINISSDLGIIAPDQRIYRVEGLGDDEQPVKPVTYSVVKHGLIGLTKYLATYWADKGVRVNALCPAGVRTDQPEEFVKKLSNLVPMGRMARIDEYKAAIVFLASDASSYMTGQSLIMDGGRSCW